MTLSHVGRSAPRISAASGPAAVRPGGARARSARSAPGRRHLACRRADRLRAVGVLVAVRTHRQRLGRVALRRAAATTSPTPGSAGSTPPPIWGTYVLVGVIGASAAMVVRWAGTTDLRSWCSSSAFVWLELIEVTTYLNHYWFVTLLGLVLSTLPAATLLVARRRRGTARASASIPARRGGARPRPGCGGLCVRRARQAQHRLAPARAAVALVAPDVTATSPSSARGSTSVGRDRVQLGRRWRFDLLVVPALCYRRTRPFAWAAIVVFHVVTWRLFPDRRVPVADDRGVDDRSSRPTGPASSSPKSAPTTQGASNRGVNP